LYVVGILKMGLLVGFTTGPMYFGCFQMVPYEELDGRQTITRYDQMALFQIMVQNLAGI